MATKSSAALPDFGDACSSHAMSLRLSAAQFDSSFRPSSLCNWEVPRDPSPITRAASPGPTKFVVGDNGHLVRAAPCSIAQF